jgi:hypothetical protein
MSWKPKRDIEYLGKLEKALEEKYGSDATINPHSLWNEEKEQDYMEQVKENAEKYIETEKDSDIVENDGIFVNKKLLTKSNATSCPVCDKYLADSRDSVYILKWECCYTCFVQWVEDREDRWKTGWRPSKEK